MWIKRIMLPVVALTLLVGIAACGNGDEPQYERFEDLEDDITETVESWDGTHLLNEGKMEQGGQVMQHMELELFTDAETGAMYMSSRDLVEDRLMNYVYLPDGDSEKVYTYQFLPESEEQDEPEEEYLIEDYEAVADNLPDPVELLSGNLEVFPTDEEPENGEQEQHEAPDTFEVDYDEDTGEFDVVAEMTMEDQMGEEQTMDWSLAGDMESFTLSISQMGMDDDLTFEETDYLEDFDEVDTDKHDYPEEDEEENGDDEQD